MKPKKLFRTALFGYKKKDVYAYLDEYAKDMMAKIQQKDEEIARLVESNRARNDDCGALRRRIDEYEEDRDRIASIIIKAEETAEIMMERAERQALLKKADIEGKIEMEAAKLQSLRAELNKLLRAANDATTYIKKELGAAQNIEQE